MIKAGIIGSTGYAGSELVRLLMGHKDVKIVWYGSKSYTDKKYYQVYQNMFRIVDNVCRDDNMEELSREADVIFTATPQGLCASLVSEEILSRCKIIDLSADFRIKDVKTYEEWYHLKHPAAQYLPEAVYGAVLKLTGNRLKQARLVANPGCYPTCSTLSIYPLLKEGLIDGNTVIIDAKSGTSGAGRGAKVDNLYCEVNENIKAYGVATPSSYAGDRGAVRLRGRLSCHHQFYAPSGAHEQGNTGDGVRFFEKTGDGRRNQGYLSPLL